MGFQFLCPRSTVLSPSDPRPPTVQHVLAFSLMPKARAEETAGPKSTLGRRLRKSAQDLNCRCLHIKEPVHLLCSIIGYNQFIRSCSTHRPDTMRPGQEKGIDSSGLARVAAHPRPPKKWKPSASGTRFCDWIGGICYADTLQVWLPASSRFLIESSGLWKQELWHWVMWDIYEWYLLHHRGAVLRGMGTFLKA